MRALKTKNQPVFYLLTLLSLFLTLYIPLNSIKAEFIDDTNPSINYSKTPKWNSIKSLSAQIWKEGTASSNVNIYSYAVFTTKNSNRIKLYATKGPDRGMADVYIDGAYKGVVDQYAFILTPSASVFDSGNLEPGNHEIKIIHNGRKSLFSINYFFEIDGFDVSFYNPDAKTIMPLGDSITFGYLNGILPSTGGYRRPLLDLFNQNGISVDFVGSQSNGTLEDKDHEGYPMYRIDQITDLVDNKGIMNGKPQYVLLHIGTNDALQNFFITSIETRISYLIDRILSKMQPGGKLYVAKVPLCGALYYIANININSYNTILTNVVNAKIAQGKPIVLVDMYSAITNYDLIDQIHPTESGYQKMANTWFNAIKDDLTNKTKTSFDPMFPVTPVGSKFDGYNIFAPEIVWNNGQWIMYYGGWQQKGETNDKIYVNISKDANFSGAWTTPDLKLSNGDWSMINDPTVVKGNDGVWYMLYTLGNLRKTPNTGGHIFDEWIGYSTSEDGKSWTPNAGSNAYKIKMTDTDGIVGGAITGIARPSLVKKGNLWYLFFDGCVNGCLKPFEVNSFVATSASEKPTSFNIVYKFPDVDFFPGFMEPDVHVKKDGSFIAVFNRGYNKILYGVSSNGKDFVIKPLINAKDVGLTVISNPSFIVDEKDQITGIIYSGSPLGGLEGMTQNKIYYTNMSL